MNIRTGRGYVFGLQYHLVWSTKYRKPILTETIANELKDILREQARAHHIVIQEMETDRDHIHLLIECTPQHYIPNVVKLLKGQSGRELFKRFPEIKKHLWGGHLWNPSYFICTVSEQTEDQIKQYIQNQQTKPVRRGRPSKTMEMG